jgi:deoxyguanosine kinase
MNHQHQVVLSIGSNLGNKLENLMQCIALIHEQIATVIRVSNIYETPSWGFDSDDFYNAAILIHTHKNSLDLLDEILFLEQKLGRVRSDEKGFQPRIIDIDIISFNEEVVKDSRLQIPHPEMHNRKFVLQPMMDLHLEWIHPLLLKNCLELLQICTDESNCKLVNKVLNPITKIDVSSFNYIAIEGNIGAGKTTLSHKLSEDFNAKLVLERFADNPFLPKFYEDQSRYAFPLEMSFLADRYQQISDDLAQFDLFKDFIVADYHIFKSLIFAKVTLAEDEFRLYKTMFSIVYKEMPKPDLYIYLYQNTDQLLKNIKRRGRSYEQEIPAEYLEKINQGYLEYIKSQKDLNVLIIDVSDRDFVEKQSDYIYILNEIQKNISMNKMSN